MLWDKQIVTFERLIENKWFFLGISVSMRAFYHVINQVDSVVSSKVIMIISKRQICLEIQWPLI